MILSDRDVFIGAHVTQEQKDAFREEAKRRRVSMSALVSEILEKFLIEENLLALRPYKNNEQEPPLPFEEA